MEINKIVQHALPHICYSTGNNPTFQEHSDEHDRQWLCPPGAYTQVGMHVNCLDLEHIIKFQYIFPIKAQLFVSSHYIPSHS